MSVDPETMEELLADVEAGERALRPLRPGEVVEGVVASVSGDEVLVDLGGRSAGVLSLREANGEGMNVAVGEHLLAAVVQPEGPDGRAVLSTRRARSRRQWSLMSELSKSGELVEAEVVEANRGGLVVDVGLRGFVPLSQLTSVGSLGSPPEQGAAPDALRALLGKRLPLRVIEADQCRDRLIPSEKAAAQEVRRQRKEKASRLLGEGEVLDGTVASVTTFGLFVDVGVADGLVHRSEITWDKGIEPTSLYQPGDAVRVLVTAVDRERRRISLSIKRLEQDPWVGSRAARAGSRVRHRGDDHASDAVRRLRPGSERYRGSDPRERDRVPSSGIPRRASTSGGSRTCPCGGYRPRTETFVALDTSSLRKCHVRNADSE